MVIGVSFSGTYLNLLLPLSLHKGPIHPHPPYQLASRVKKKQGGVTAGGSTRAARPPPVPPPSFPPTTTSAALVTCKGYLES
jgi:hypothetical protein